MCFVQGGDAVLSSLPATWPSHLSILGCTSLHCSLPVPPWCSTNHLSHSLHGGGVVDAEWLFFSNEASLLQVSQSDHMQRRVKHITDPTRKAANSTPARPRVHWLDQAEGAQWIRSNYPLVHWGGALPVEVADTVKVLCPSVYSPTKWVVQQLTTRELIAAFDVTETLAIPECEGSCVPFLKEAPSRLMGVLLEQFQGRERITLNTPVRHAQPQWPPLEGLVWKGESASTKKSDDAEAPAEVWNDRVLKVSHDAHLLEVYPTRFGKGCLDGIRGWLLRVWRRRLWKSLRKYLYHEHGPWWNSIPKPGTAQARDQEVGKDCLCRASGATWWEWPIGSTPFFWRWPSFSLVLVRDGHPPWIVQKPPRFMRPQQLDKDPETAQKIKSKLENVALKGYIRPGTIKSLTRYFAVPKGDTNV